MTKSSNQNSLKFVDQSSKIPHQINRVPITNLNPHLTCALCSGYLIDATTIVECLHAFCRACLLRYLETSDTCPICDTMINRSQLHKSIRSDQTLQDLVYKLIPSLYKSELQKRKEFCLEHCKNASADASTSSKIASTNTKLYQIFDKNLVDLASSICSPDEIVSFSLECFFKSDKTDKKSIVSSNNKSDKPSQIMNGLNNYKRYFRCPAGVKVLHLKKLLAHKLDLSTCHQVEIWHLSNDVTGDELMKEEWTLMDIALLYSWKRKSPLQLHFNVCKYDVEEEPMPELIREPEQQTPPSSSSFIHSSLSKGHSSSDANPNLSSSYDKDAKSAASGAVEYSQSSGSSSCGSQEFRRISPIYPLSNGISPIPTYPTVVGNSSVATGISSIPIPSTSEISSIAPYPTSVISSIPPFPTSVGISPIPSYPTSVELSPSPCQLSPTDRIFIQPAKLRLKKSLSSVVQQLTTPNNNNDSKIAVDHMTLHNIGLPAMISGTKDDSPTTLGCEKLPITKKIKHENRPINEITEKFLINTNNSFKNGSKFIAQDDFPKGTAIHSANKSESSSNKNNNSTPNSTGIINSERVLCT